MFLFGVKCLIWSALEIEFFELYFLQPVLGGHSVLSGHLAGAPNENIVQNHLNIALLNVF